MQPCPLGRIEVCGQLARRAREKRRISASIATARAHAEERFDREPVARNGPEDDREADPVGDGEARDDERRASPVGDEQDPTGDRESRNRVPTEHVHTLHDRQRRGRHARWIRRDLREGPRAEPCRVTRRLVQPSRSFDDVTENPGGIVAQILHAQLVAAPAHRGLVETGKLRPVVGHVAVSVVAVGEIEVHSPDRRQTHRPDLESGCAPPTEHTARSPPRRRGSSACPRRAKAPEPRRARRLGGRRCSRVARGSPHRTRAPDQIALLRRRRGSAASTSAASRSGAWTFSGPRTTDHSTSGGITAAKAAASNATLADRLSRRAKTAISGTMVVAASTLRKLSQPSESETTTPPPRNATYPGVRHAVGSARPARTDPCGPTGRRGSCNPTRRIPRPGARRATSQNAARRQHGDRDDRSDRAGPHSLRDVRSFEHRAIRRADSLCSHASSNIPSTEELNRWV